jgi:hypothetical protein
MIHTIRGMRVMLDRDLAKIYGVPTFRFNEAIKRNRDRFRRTSCSSLHARSSIPWHRKMRCQKPVAVAGALSATRLLSTAHFRLQIVRISVRPKRVDYNPTASLYSSL